MADNGEDARFMNLVLSLAAAGMQHLGKKADPASGAAQPDLPQAQAVIEMLDMLVQKTRGNLSSREEGLVTGALADLQLNFADESARQHAAADKT